ncbi:MAG TPA: hypothetical protein VKG38_08015 [Solirubrobacteraceae bacterium]|nr:hypothetical protein [Solirubrobacteraceae bacterium]
MPQQNVVTRLESVAVGLGRLADELERLYGEPTPNLLYWRSEIIEVAEELKAGGSPAAPAPGSTA